MDIYVGNLPYSADDQDLKELFEQYGKVTSARVVMDKFSGQSKGFGFVEMPDSSEANQAIDATNEQEFMGRNLRVNESSLVLAPVAPVAAAAVVIVVVAAAAAAAVVAVAAIAGVTN